jgi:predicted ATP-binding protein involved in virulence
VLTQIIATKINDRISVQKSVNPDINIVTGRNGSGKTTFLKLVWFCLSGNIERIPREINFEHIRVQGKDFFVELKMMGEHQQQVRVTAAAGKQVFDFSCTLQQLDDEIDKVQEINHAFARAFPTVFFPTFRRVEGGYYLPSRRSASLRRGGDFDTFRRGIDADIRLALETVSDRMSVGKHRFVCSISTADVVNLLTTRYAEVSRQTNAAHSELARKIITEIESQETLSSRSARVSVKRNPEARVIASKLTQAMRAMEKIKNYTNDFRSQQERLLAPFQELSSTIAKIIDDKEIHINESIFLGREGAKIPSDQLSAGEKQILSFLIYNAFFENAIIFIDEPELSLHVDWQRMLLPILLAQGTSNQFFIATHSPFIYAKFADKEIQLGER